jgi:hypothetical protein
LNHWNFGSYDETQYWLEQVLRFDPGWSWGWAQLAALLMRFATVHHDLDYRERARRILLDAPRSEDARTEFVVYESWLSAYWDGDLAGAEARLRPLAEKGYSWPYAMLMLVSGLHRESEAYFRRLTRICPFVPVGWEMLLQARLNLADTRGAITAGQELVRLYGAAALNAPSLLCQALAHGAPIDQAEAARTELARRVRQLPDGTQRLLSESSLHRTGFMLALRKEDRNAALEAAHGMARLGRQGDACVMFLRMGDERLAADSLAHVVPDLDRWWWWGTTTHLTPALEGHAQIETLRRSLGFTQEWRYELARRAACLPARSGIECDPIEYAPQREQSERRPAGA